MSARVQYGTSVMVVGQWPPYKEGEVFEVTQDMRLTNIAFGVNQGRLLVLEDSKEKVAGDVKIYARHTGRGNWDLIKGIKLNDAPLSKEDVEEYL